MMILPQNLGACLVSAAAERIALIDIADPASPRTITYGPLDHAIAAAAGGLAARGLAPGARIGLLSLNRWEYVVLFLAAMRGGFVAVPISIKFPADTIAHVVRDAALSLLVHDAARTSLLPEGVPALDLDDNAAHASLFSAPAAAVAAVAPHDLAMILYTSGSTGMPKGVLLSHESQRWALRQALRINGDISGERYIVAAPLFHMNATFSTQLALAGGASLVLMPSFNARLYAEAIARFQITALTSVPTMLALVARERAAGVPVDTSSVRRVMMGSAPLTQALINKVQAMFPGVPITNSYGTTEAGPLVFGPHPEGKPRPSLSIGYPLAGGEVALREGPSPDEGVLYMRNPALMAGYNNLPGKTAEAMRDGWYRSGDIMRRDADGWFYFLGRADDMFVVGGENVWPSEVESVIERMPGVHQACVVPVSDEIKGALPFAFVVLRPGTTLDEAAVKAWCLANAPAFAHPRFVAFIDAIPLAGTNKPDRRMLRERAETLADERRAAASPDRGTATP
jgi:acyl-CoA synthetase (AMP-forming)/AMP-acid ligase II